MKQILPQILLILILSIIFSNCRSNSKTEMQYYGEKSQLSAEVFAKLDYKVKEFGESLPDDWHKNQFQTVWQRSYFVKRNTTVKEQPQTFPRFWVREEVYENEESAANRFRKIQDRPPEFINYDYWIVTGFQHQKNVYFVQTDSVLFSYYMKDFADNLEKEIKNR